MLHAPSHSGAEVPERFHHAWPELPVIGFESYSIGRPMETALCDC